MSTKADPNAVTAIDILLEPDAGMLQHAQAVNDRLLRVFPKGFALDATHRPHITLVQRFVLTENLDKVYAAVGRVFASANVTGLKLEAFKHYYIPNKDIGLSGIVIKPTPDLIKLEVQVIDAVTPFAVKTGTSAAFVTGDVPEVLPALIAYVTEFVPKSCREETQAIRPETLRRKTGRTVGSPVASTTAASRQIGMSGRPSVVAVSGRRSKGRSRPVADGGALRKRTLANVTRGGSPCKQNRPKPACPTGA
jgi:hypothetical protein